MIRAVFFDLDDTLFDHQYSRRCGLEVLRTMQSALRGADIHAMERYHEQLIWSDYERVLSGEIPIHDAMTQRICALCDHFGHPLDPAGIPATVRNYDAAYRGNRRAVPGSRELLEALRGRVKIGIITNGFTALQNEKIAICGIAPFIDILVISEEAGYRKPDRRIFEKALALAGTSPAESCFIGDSWNVDIVPAAAYGMKAVWLNRYGLPCQDTSRACEITSYGGLDVGELLG